MHRAEDDGGVDSYRHIRVQPDSAAAEYDIKENIPVYLNRGKLAQIQMALTENHFVPVTRSWISELSVEMRAGSAGKPARARNELNAGIDQ